MRNLDVGLEHMKRDQVLSQPSNHMAECDTECQAVQVPNDPKPIQFKSKDGWMQAIAPVRWSLKRIFGLFYFFKNGIGLNFVMMTRTLCFERGYRIDY